jgi:hypothetical protein
MCPTSRSTLFAVSLYIVFFCGEGPRSRCYGSTAALRLIVQPCDEDGKFFSFSHFNAVPVKSNRQGKIEVLGFKTLPVSLCPPQIPHGSTRDRNMAAVVRPANNSMTRQNVFFNFRFAGHR